MDIAAWSSDFSEFVWAENVSPNEFSAAAESGRYPTLQDIYTLTPVFTVLIAFMRILLQFVVFKRVSKWFLPTKEAVLPFQSEVLEAFHLRSKTASQNINELKVISTQISHSIEEINAWFRIRQLKDRNEAKCKACAESMWRLFIYGFSLTYNLRITKDMPWVNEIDLCWEGLPLQPQEPSVKLFYVAVAIPLYLVLLGFQLWDRKRASDAWEMTMHHGLVVSLLTLVYLGNFCRIGMIGMALHDVTDLIFESSKLSHKFRYWGLADLLFAIFGFSWAYARLYKFCTVVHYSLLVTGTKVLGPIVNVFVAMLLLLFLLNLYWFFMILRMMHRIFWVGANAGNFQREFTDLSTDDDTDSDSSYISDIDAVKLHAD